MIKTCTICGKAKEVCQFANRRAAKDGRCPYCRDCGAKGQRDYYRAHPDKLAAKHSRYRQTHREKIAAKSSAEYRNDPALAKSRFQGWSARNPGRKKEIQQRYAKANREKLAAKARNRHALRKGAGGSHTASDTHVIFERQRGLCAYCSTDLTKCVKHLDHWMPLSRGGSNGPKNLQWLCATCNLAKGAQDPVAFEASLSVMATDVIGHRS